MAGLPGHQVLRVLRTERTGEVVAARRDIDDALVVLRILPAVLVADAAYMTRLRRDVGRLAEQPHPTLIEAHAFFDTDQGVAVESEFSDGIRLDDVLASTTLPEEAAAVVLVDLLDGLAWLHHLGVFHLDVRPGTIVVEAGGRVRLGDAGIAVPTFRPGSAPGTPAYMAPELWNEEAPTASTDIYAATATAFEAFTGRTPFAARRVQAMRAAHLRGRPDPTGVPDYMRPLLAAGLAKASVGRPPSAAAFRDAVKRAVERRHGSGWVEHGRAQLAVAVLCVAATLPSALIAGMSDEPIAPSGPSRFRRRPVVITVPWRRMAVALAIPVLVLCAAAFFWTHGNGAARASTIAPAAPHAAAPSGTAVVAPAAAVPTSTPGPTPRETPRPTPARPVTFVTPTPKPTPTPVATPSGTPHPSPSPT